MKTRNRWVIGRVVVMLLALGVATELRAETVMVKYRGVVNLAPFQCEWLAGSSFVNRLCYDRKESYVVVSLRGTYYHYCEVPAAVVVAWKGAASAGGFYNEQVKGRYDCRVLRVPTYGE